MIGITSYSAHVPRLRLPRALISNAWGSRAVPGCKAVANFDEDTVTMAQAAASKLLSSAPDAIYFASTSAPHWQRSSASMVAAFSDLPPETVSSDFGGSLRAGTMALRSALDAVKSESSRSVVVVASESRDGLPESVEEMTFGDAAAAVAVGGEHVIAEVMARASTSDDFLDEWRRDADRFVNAFPSKFSTERGYEANAVAVGRALLKKASLEPTDVARLALASLDGRAQTNVAKALGIAPDRIEDPRLADIGVTGTAMPILLLAQSLEGAQEGDVIISIGYGDGADGFLFRVTPEITNLPRPLLNSSSTRTHYSYQIYRKLRSFLRDETTGPELSNVLWERQEHQNVRLRGIFCPACGTLQFPYTAMCGHCHNTKDLIERPLGRRGRVFTFNKDYLYDSPVQPTVNAVVDLDGGARFLCQMTDIDESQVKIGMEVELVLRRMRGAASMHHYYWKCRPLD